MWWAERKFDAEGLVGGGSDVSRYCGGLFVCADGGVGVRGGDGVGVGVFGCGVVRG